MKEYVSPSREIIVALKAIGEIEKGIDNLTEEDDIFAGNRLRFPLGTVIAVSRMAAENAIWTETQDHSWDNRAAAKGRAIISVNTEIQKP